MALASIWSLSGPSLVRSSTRTPVILVPRSPTWTCIGPYCVSATAPVTIRVAAALPPIYAGVTSAGRAPPDRTHPRYAEARHV